MFYLCFSLVIFAQFDISMPQRKTTVTPLLTHWSYCNLVLSNLYTNHRRSFSTAVHTVHVVYQVPFDNHQISVKCMTASLFVTLASYLQTNLHESLSLLSPALMQLGSSFLCFYLGSVAIKLMMQRLSYSLPLYLSLPTVLLVLILRCEDIMPDIVVIRWVFDTSECDASMDWTFSCAAVILWIASLWTARHVWWYGHEKLAKREKLFVMPFYLGVFLVPSLLLNRRDDDKEDLSKQQNTGDMYVSLGGEGREQQGRV